MKTPQTRTLDHPTRVCGALGRQAWCVMLTVMVAHGSGLAQIRTDASLGQAARTLSGPAYVIPQSLGRLAGNNLFHSFQAFNVNSGESAQFTTSTVGLGNVISRVTGGTASLINGPLSLAATGATPHFYFINPAGVTFGAGASIDVPAAFHVSSAHYLKFADGNFYADTTSASTFSSAEPAAFGFLGNSSASILLKDSVLSNAAGGITLVGGDVGIDQAGVWTGSSAIRIVASGAVPLEVGLSGALPSASGRFEMTGGSSLYTAADAQSGGGQIAIAAGDASLLAGALVVTETSTTQPAGAITLNLTGLEIDGRSAAGSTGITSRAAVTDTGAGGLVAVTARDAIRVLGGGMITSDTYGLGAAGNVSIKAGSLLLDGAGHDKSARITNWGNEGQAGLLEVDVTGAIELVNAGQISSSSFGAGQAGNIQLHAGGDFRILSDGSIASDAFAGGHAGRIDLSAQHLTLDATGGKLLTQVSSQALHGSSGDAGSIHISTPASLTLVNGGRIVSDTHSVGQAGDIHVNTGALLLDGRDYNGSTGIFSSASQHSSGHGGTINVDVAGDAQILQSAKVSSSTWSLGRGGDIVFKAHNLLIDGMGNRIGAAISSEATVLSGGDGGSVTVDVAGHLRIGGYGSISATTLAHGNAGPVSVQAGQLTLDGQAAGLASIESTSMVLKEYGDISGDAGSVSVRVAGDALLTGGGRMASDTWSVGHGGDVKLVVGGQLDVINDGAISTFAGGNGPGGNLDIQVAGDLNIGNKGQIQSTTRMDGDGGNLTIKVGGHLNVGGQGYIRSDTTGGSGKAGSINIQASQVLLARGNIEHYAWILSDSYGSGNAGSVNVQASNSIELAEGGFISSDSHDTGHAGTVSVSAPDLRIGATGPVYGAAISSDAYAEGNAGRVEVSAQKLTILQGSRISSSTKTKSSGDGGDIDIHAAQVVLSSGDVKDIAWILSDSYGSGNAGSVNVQASERIELAEGSFITSDAYASGHAGSILVKAPDIRIGGTELGYGAAISSDTYASGNAGQVEVTAQTLTIQGSTSKYPTGITSHSLANSSGNAGTVVVNAAVALQVSGGGVITSGTGGLGRGGEVQVKAGSITLSGAGSQIGAVASAASSGQPGNIQVSADSTLMLDANASLSIENAGNSSQPAAVSASTLTVSAAQLSLQDGAAIKANATGNVAAGALQIDASEHLSLTQASITTSANSGNGGPISLKAGQWVDLNRSQITTSVLGAVGSGGNIAVAADALVMNSGFIQANTAASNASGGLVGINVNSLVASGNTLWVGGQSPYDFAPGIFGFNVVQAAAPTGVSGSIAITSPVLDVSGSLRGLDAQLLGAGELGRNPCQTRAGSSLVSTGRGGLPPSIRGLLRVEPPDGSGPATAALAWRPTGGCP